MLEAVGLRALGLESEVCRFPKSGLGVSGCVGGGNRALGVGLEVLGI